MKTNLCCILRWVVGLQLVLTSLPGLENAFAASNISSTDKYAWSENAGWINFRPTHGGVSIDQGDPYKFDGYAWSENIGWIHFQNASPSYAVALDSPLVVNLISFTATGFNDRVVITWGHRLGTGLRGFSSAAPFRRWGICPYHGGPHPRQRGPRVGRHLCLRGLGCGSRHGLCL